MVSLKTPQGTPVIRSCYLKCGPWTSSVSITRELVREAGAQAAPRPTASACAREQDLRAGRQRQAGNWPVLVVRQKEV